MIAVHEYEVWVDTAGAYELTPGKATAAFIHSVGGRIIPGTEEHVDASQLTPEGEYDPLPLGVGTTDLA